LFLLSIDQVVDEPAQLPATCPYDELAITPASHPVAPAEPYDVYATDSNTDPDPADESTPPTKDVSIGAP
jgi:hypothetical protein